MKLPRPFSRSSEHICVDLGSARALFTTRRGGSSGGPYATLNLGRMTGDDPDAVKRNRQLLSERLGMQVSMIRQVHGTRIRRLEREEDVVQAGSELPEADGQVVSVSGVAAMVLVADCVPIALAGAKTVAILHAGWRGLAEGIIEAGVQSVRDMGGDGELQAAIGPGAGPCCYEVGEEVHRHFTGLRSHVRRGGKLDLKAIARAQLERAGVDSVVDVGLCTICEPSLFYSHRRDHGVTGRQAGVVWLS